MAEQKMTKKIALQDIIDVNPITEEHIAIFTAMIAQLDKKRSTSGKPTATQRQNMVLTKEVLRFLAENEGTQFTASELTEVEGLPKTTQKISPMLKTLLQGGKVKREQNGKKVLWSVADGVTEADYMAVEEE